VIVDTSAVIAILFGEPERADSLRAIAAADRPRMSAASYVECGIVIDSLTDPVLSVRLDQLLEELRIEIEPVTAGQARLARDAARQYGRGSGRPARLNYGDCFSYAAARSLGRPLLFTGDDFSQTDLRSALD
jgi:ribonuclease VapC